MSATEVSSLSTAVDCTGRTSAEMSVTEVSSSIAMAYTGRTSVEISATEVSSLSTAVDCTGRTSAEMPATELLTVLSKLATYSSCNSCCCTRYELSIIRSVLLRYIFLYGLSGFIPTNQSHCFGRI